MTLPGALAAQGIVVVLHETVHEVDGPEGILDPFYIELVPLAQIAGTVVLDQQPEGAFLNVVLSNEAGLLQLRAYLLDGGAIDAADLPGLLHHLSVFLHHLGIQAVRYRTLVFWIRYGCVVRLNLVTGHAVIEIDGRSGHDIAVRCGAAPLGAHLRIVNIIHQECGLFSMAH